MDTAPDDAEPPAKRLKPNDPTYVHIRLPLRLSTALSDPVFVECQNVEFIRNNNPSNKYLLHIASLVLGNECISIRIRRREDGGDAADDDVSWADISETGDIRGGTYLCDFEDCMEPCKRLLSCHFQVSKPDRFRWHTFLFHVTVTVDLLAVDMSSSSVLLRSFLVHPSRSSCNVR
jgi:hypothetical protein